MKSKFILKRDMYQQVRGNPHFLTIFCEHCQKPLLLYQKDGGGPLMRLYFDRIVAPIVLTNLDKEKHVENLVCPSCHRLIAVPHIFEKENRKVYALLSFAFVAKRSRGVFPPEKII